MKRLVRMLRLTRNDEYRAQAYEGERWKVIPVIEEVKEKAKAACCYCEVRRNIHLAGSRIVWPH